MTRVVILLMLTLLVQTASAFTSLYVFGDSVSTVTNGDGSASYYGYRNCNGRVWVEVLAQRQGIAFVTNNNWSFYGHYSPNLVTNTASFVAPADASNALFVIWVNDADFVNLINLFPPYTTNNLGPWTNRMNASVSNHLVAIQNLFNKGARTLLMPNVVDLSKIPLYNGGLTGPESAFIRQRIVDYNAAFSAMLTQAQVAFTNLNVRPVDFFTLLDRILTNAPAYGLTNATLGGAIVDALSDDFLTNKTLNGPGANYIFWDFQTPGAKTQAVMADVAHQSLTPTRVASVTNLTGTNRLEAVNLPVGLGGFVDATTNFNTWSLVQSFASTNATQGILVPQSGPQQFYRLRFPFAWSWP